MEERSLKSFGLQENTKNLEKILSVKLKTLPEFIIVKGEKFIDVLKYIKKTKDKLDKVLTNLKRIDKQQIILLYLGFNESFKRKLDNAVKMGFDKEKFIETTLESTNIKISGIVQKINKMKDKIKQQIREYIENYKKIDKHNIEKGELVKEEIEVVCSYGKYDIDYIFNQIQISDDTLPFVYYKKRDKTFFKIYKYFQSSKLKEVPEQWFYNLLRWKQFVEDNDKIPVLYNYYREAIHGDQDKFDEEQFLYKWMLTQQKSYVKGNLEFLKLYKLLEFNFPLPNIKIKPKIIMKYQDIKTVKNIEIYLDTDQNLTIKFIAIDNKNRDEILNKISESFKAIKLNKPVIRESIITSSISFKMDTFYDKYIFLDLISNNSFFSKYLYVNEFEKVDKSKENTIWVYYKTSRDFGKGVTISITKSKYDNNTLNLKIKKSNEKVINQIITTMEELLKIYCENKEDIIKFYRRFIRGFPKVKSITKKVKKGVKTLDPDLFPPSIKSKSGKKHGYSRTCQKKNQPVLNYKGPKLEKDRFFRFPIGIKEKPTREYACVNEKYKWPGLKILPGIDEEQKNKLLLKGFVPCCYANKKGEPAKKMKKYLEGGLDSILEKKKKVKKQTNIDETKYLITNGRTNTFKFNLFQKGEYFRKGFAKNKTITNPNSFLYCIYYIYREDFENLFDDNLDFKKIDAFFTEERQKFASDPNTISLCKQEMFDKSEEQIISIISDKNTYFDPKMFINILADKFSCNIFLFEQIDKKVKMVLPRHIYGYYHDLSNENAILIYLNYGSLSSKSSYPQCEIIAIKNKQNMLEMIFDKNSEKSIGFDLYSELIRSFNILTSDFSINRPLNVTEQKFNIAQKFLKSQHFDIYGKTRILNFKYQNNNGTIMTSPIQPIGIKQAKELKIYKIPPQVAVDFFKKELKIDYKYIIKEKERVALFGVLNNIRCTIPIISDRNIESKVAIYQDFNIPEKSSILEKFSSYSRIARCLQSYTLWLYSSIKKETGESGLDLISELKDFEEKYFIIIKGHKYVDLSNKLSLKSSFIKKGKIIVDSAETRKRLIYYLLVNIKNDSNFVLNYHEKEYIPSYFSSLQDYQNFSTEILLEGFRSFKNWYTKPANFVFYNKIVPTSEELYLFSNPNLNEGELYIAINSEAIDQAVKIVKFWNKNGFVPDVEEIDEVEYSKNFILFAYENKVTIEKYIIGTGDRKVNIVGYKDNDTPFYTALLKI